MLVRSRTPTPATESQRATDVSATLERRAAMSNPPGSIAVPPAAAVAIAGLFHRPTPSGPAMDRFHITGEADSEELVEGRPGRAGLRLAGRLRRPLLPDRLGQQPAACRWSRGGVVTRNDPAGWAAQ